MSRDTASMVSVRSSRSAIGFVLAFLVAAGPFSSVDGGTEAMANAPIGALEAVSSADENVSQDGEGGGEEGDDSESDAILECLRNWPAPTTLTALRCYGSGLVAGVIMFVLMVAVFFKLVPLTANSGLSGAMRRAREGIPLVGRVFRPKITVEAVESSGEAGPLSNSLVEHVVEELTEANRADQLEERLVADSNVGADLAATVGRFDTGLGGVASWLAARVPRARLRIRLMLHEPTEQYTMLSVDITDRGDKVLRSQRFTGDRLVAGGDYGVDDPASNYLLVRNAAAWVAFELPTLWAGDSDGKLERVNTSSGRSFGHFREGVLLEDYGQELSARQAYHSAITADRRNAGAVINLARLDSRERRRLDDAIDRLSDAIIMVDNVADEVEQRELRVRVRYLLATARFNRALVRILDAERVDRIPGTWIRSRARPQYDRSGVSTATRGGLLAPVDAAWSALTRLARELGELREAADERPELKEIAEAFEARTLTLAAAMEVEYEWLVDSYEAPPNRPGMSIEQAIELLAAGMPIRFKDLRDALSRPGRQLPVSARYALGCALARRRSFDDAARLIADAVRGDAQLREWACAAEGGDPALDELRTIGQAWARVPVDS